MNKIKFIYKFYFNRHNNGHFNWNLLFPFAGVIIGCMTVSLTIAIMEGMEHAIFNKLKNVSFPAKLIHIKDDSTSDLEIFLNKQKIKYLNGIEDQILIMNDKTFRIATIHGIENINIFKNNFLINNLNEIIIDSPIPIIYLGMPLANKLDITLGDTIDISVHKEINIITGLPSKRSMIVGGIYRLNILDYDHKHIFTDYNSLKDFIPDSRSLYYLNEIPGENIVKTITQNFPDLKVHTWEDEHHSFIKAMKMEKIAYSFFGFLIVGIAGFTLMSMMSLSVMQKIPQIGILGAMGTRKEFIGAIFLIQAFITWIISSSLGIILSLIIINLDKSYHFIEILFPGAVFYDFPLILNNNYILLIMFVSLLLLMSAAIYPSIKAANIDPVQSIGFNR